MVKDLFDELWYDGRYRRNKIPEGFDEPFGSGDKLYVDVNLQLRTHPHRIDATDGPADAGRPPPSP
jgi:hypothetical protein